MLGKDALTRDVTYPDIVLNTAIQENQTGLKLDSLLSVGAICSQ